jgi:hypothetical protein
MTAGRWSKRPALHYSRIVFTCLLAAYLAAGIFKRFRKSLILVGDTGIEPVTPAV